MAQVKLKWPDSVPIDQIDIPFLQGMLNRMAFGFHNYGHMRRYENVPHSLKNVQIRLREYRRTKNTEFLMDAANYCMMEFVRPSLKGAYFRATSKVESPGAVVDGKLVKGKGIITSDDLMTRFSPNQMPAVDVYWLLRNWLKRAKQERSWSRPRIQDALTRVQLDIYERHCSSHEEVLTK